MTEQFHILVVDDSPSVRLSLCKTLRKQGYRLSEAESGKAALAVLERQEVDLMLTDLKMPGMDGVELTRQVLRICPTLQVILVTAFATVETAVEAMRHGAADYLKKPVERTELFKVVRKALETRRLLTENERLRQQLERLEKPGRLVGRSRKMQRLLDLIGQVAPSRATVLIQGESGTGKELVAHDLHDLSPRRNKPFIKVACAALPESLLEAELFGHEKGAFTGALVKKEGRFKLADGGTLLLDEIGDLPLSMQVKLLRVLQEGEFERVGGTTTMKVDVRIISATNRDLAKEVSKGRFREDLFYRLNVITLNIAPLREREEDIPILAEHFFRLYSQRNSKEDLEFSRAALDWLMGYSWPGNVRELENAIERAVVLARGRFVLPEDLPPKLQTHPHHTVEDGDRICFRIGTPLQEVEQTLLEETLRYTDGDKEAAAAMLGISSRTIYRQLARQQESAGKIEGGDGLNKDRAPGLG